MPDWLRGQGWSRVSGLSPQEFLAPKGDRSMRPDSTQNLCLWWWGRGGGDDGGWLGEDGYGRI